MVTSSSLTLTLTALYVVTGGWALVRLTHVATGRGPAADVVAELSHLAMGVVMIAMAWGVVSGPAGVGGAVTLAVFGVAALWALARLVRGSSPHRTVVTGHHLLMASAMVWMVAAMPQIMGVTDDRTSRASHDMTGMPGMAGMAPTGSLHGPVTPVWITTLTWVFVLLLVAAGSLWTLHAVRPSIPPRSTGSPGADAPGAVALLAPPRTTVVTSTGVHRLDACCHVLMSLGMAGMIVTML